LPLAWRVKSTLTSYAFALPLGVDLEMSVREAVDPMGHSQAVHLSIYGR